MTVACWLSVALAGVWSYAAAHRYTDSIHTLVSASCVQILSRETKLATEPEHTLLQTGSCGPWYVTDCSVNRRCPSSLSFIIHDLILVIIKWKLTRSSIRDRCQRKCPVPHMLSLASMLVMGVTVMFHGGKGIKIMLGLCPYRLRKRIWSLQPWVSLSSYLLNKEDNNFCPACSEESHHIYFRSQAPVGGCWSLLSWYDI